MNMKKRARPIQMILDYFIILVGSLLTAVSIIVFIKPSEIPLGGVFGIALILNYLFKSPVGIAIIILNIPIFILGYKYFGKSLLFRTVIATVLSSVFTDTLAPFLPAYQGDTLLSALFAGALMGAGLGLIFTRGATSGGTDIISKLIHLNSNLTIGTINLYISAVIIAISAFIYHSMEAALYAVVVQYMSSYVMDSILMGLDLSTSAIIITDKPGEVSAMIMEEIGHGVTALAGRGMYSGNDKSVLICAVRRQEAVVLRRLLLEADPAAFMMLASAQEIYGTGFKSLRT